MSPDEEFAEILRRIAPMSDDEKAETLLSYFAWAMQSMDTASLRQFRRYCWERSEDTEAEIAMLDIIDGQLALREIVATSH